jgi:hypothetical protein
MYRVVRQGRKLYAIEIDRLDEDEIENISIFIEEGEVVFLTNSLESLQEMLFDDSNIVLVEKED